MEEATARRMFSSCGEAGLGREEGLSLQQFTNLATLTPATSPQQQQLEQQT